MPKNKAKTVDLGIGLDIAKAFTAGGDERQLAVARFTRPPWNSSVATLYRTAEEFGWGTDRPERPDAGRIQIDGITEEEIIFGVKVILTTTRNKLGKRLMSTEDLLHQLVLNGHPALKHVAPSTFNTWLRERGLTHAELMSDGPAVSMRSLHPNFIHFVDASICVQWDLGDRKKLVSRDMQKSFYKNKPGYWRSVRKVLIRWVVADHCSGCFYVDYSYASGENSADLLNFLIDAWSPKDYAARYPFLGAPFMLGMDPGSANLSYETKNFISKLGIQSYVHAPGNARASGCVEFAHGYWERQFENQLLLKAADDLDDLRARAFDRMIFLNATAIHERHGKTRSAKWMEITQEQLRLLPPKEHCHKLATSRPVDRAPNNWLRISFEGRDYQLSAPARKGQKVWLDHNPWQEHEICVWTAERDGEPIPCRLIEKDQHGFDVTASVFGEEQYQRHAYTPAQQVKAQLKAEGLEGFEPKLTAHLVPNQHFMPRKGTDILSAAELPKAPPMAAAEVPSRLRKELGIGRITMPMRQQLEGWLDSRECISEAEFKGILEQAACWLREEPVGESLQMVG